ncbi:hypothetical protein [Gordonia insulae]|uniref:Uncharacterized protein n=1 Tax=Gordonia insulae TaxID=2420509 RepID=A0A3G8JN33_9ACTN|nr:hypothetical protein [Gordonia insulae]AZG46318.1 hypothetical protein D7316_02919 [Gordonia insulae]
MSYARRRLPPQRLTRGPARTGLLLGIAFAILLMHSVVAHCVSDDAALGHYDSGASHGYSTTISSAQSLADETMGAAGDCGAHQHACVFVRAGEPDVFVPVLLLLWWGFPVPPLLQSVRARLNLRAGRPPPWAMPSHLQLQVIRC